MSTPTNRPNMAWTLVLASLGVFMTALDTLVVANSLPALRESLHANLGDLEWTVNAYNLAFAVALLTGAALGDRHGRKRIYWIGLLGFTLASAAAALSTSVGALIAARGVQGTAAALVMPMTLTLISEAFPAEKRGAAIGLWGGITGLAVALGPVVGGAIVGGLSWHWIFWLNVPIGLALVPLSISRLTESFGPRSQLDVTGLLLAGVGFFGITWGLIRANRVGWSSGETVTALVLGVGFVAAFLWWERHTATPMVSRSLFRSRGFNAANGVSFFMYASLFGVLFLMMQFLQTALHYSPLQAGLRTLPWTGAPMLVSPIAGALADRFGNRPFMVIGLAMQATGLAWIAVIAKPGVSYWPLAIAFAVAGIGISMCFPTVANAVVGSVPPSEMGIASGTNSALREIGGVFGVAILATVFAHPGDYTSASVFIDHFKDAVRLGAAFSAIGIVAAVAVPGRAKPHPQTTRTGDIMNNDHFTTTFTVDQTPEAVFAAINDVRGWWSGQIDGDTVEVGDVFTYRYEDVHRSTQQITSSIPGHRVVWHVVDSYLDFATDKNEWTGTDMTFDISRNGNQTEVRFTHVGLARDIECFESCSSAWAFYINGSLRNLITNGNGQPNPAESVAADAR